MNKTKPIPKEFLEEYTKTMKKVIEESSTEIRKNRGRSAIARCNPRYPKMRNNYEYIREIL